MHPFAFLPIKMTELQKYKKGIGTEATLDQLVKAMGKPKVDYFEGKVIGYRIGDIGLMYLLDQDTKKYKLSDVYKFE